MSIRQFSRYAIAALMVVGMTACAGRPSLGAVTPEATQTAAPSPTATQPTPTNTTVPPTATNPAAAGSCSNPLSPVNVGATWTYSTTAAGMSPVGFSTTITAVNSDGFTVTTKFDDNVTADQPWACKPEGLVALSLGSGQTALGLSLAGITADLTASNPTGITLPANVQPGLRWPYGLEIAGTLTQGTLSATLKGKVDTQFQAIGMESVTVPAGTFNAMKVQGMSTFNVTADYHGLGIPITSVINTTFWFAPGVGWVKATESGELVGTVVNSDTELQSFNLP